eukprot:1970161-Pyramimonas_sp.AAC.1
MAVRSVESFSMTSASDEDFEAESAPDPTSVPGHDAAFATGQRRRLSYGRVLKTTPGYVASGRGVKRPSEDLTQFLTWLDANSTQREDGSY